MVFCRCWHARALRGRLLSGRRRPSERVPSWLKRRIINATSEAFNIRIQSPQAAARVFHPFFRPRTRMILLLDRQPCG